MEKETHTAAGFMRKFFDNLAEFKKFVEEKAKETDIEEIKEIRDYLEKIFKIERKL